MIALLFADDTVLKSTSADDLQKCFNDFKNYCLLWKFKVNTAKPKVMVFGTNKRGTCNLNFYLNNKEIEIVDSYKYISVVLSGDGN